MSSVAIVTGTANSKRLLRSRGEPKDFSTESLFDVKGAHVT